MSERQLIECMTPCLERFALDLKSLLRMVDDGELSDGNRVRIAGVLINVLSEASPIPGVSGILRYVGDVLITRLVLQRVAQEEPEVFKRYLKEHPAFVGSIEKELQAARAYLGPERMKVFESQAQNVDKLSYQGHAANKCIEVETSGDWLYDSIVEALVERLDFDEQAVARELRGIGSVLKPLEAKAKRLQK